MSFTEGQDVIFCNCQDVYLRGTKGNILLIHEFDDGVYYTARSELYNMEHRPMPAKCFRPLPDLGNLREMCFNIGLRLEYKEK